MLNTIAAALAILLNAYIAHTAAHAYIVVFTYNHKVYGKTFYTIDNLIPFLKVDRGSNGYDSMRLDVKATTKSRWFMGDRVDFHMSTAEFKALTKRFGNAGDAAEALVANKFKSVAFENFKHNSVEFWKAGDINIGGMEVQVKFENGTFINGKTIEEQEAKGAMGWK